MDDESKPEEILRKLHEERAREGLEEIAQRLASMLDPGNPRPTCEKAPADGAHHQTLQRLDRLSKSWERIEKSNKTAGQEALWDQLVDACYTQEIETLKQQGFTEGAASQLVRVERAWWDTDSGRFETGSVAPQFEASVQVVVVQRETGFRIHDELLANLWQHPVFVEHVAGTRAGSPYDVFKNTLSIVEDIAHDYDFEGWNEIPSYDELDGEDRRALVCMLAGLELEYLLALTGTDSVGFPDGDEPASTEDLNWLNEARQGQHLWRLLNSAVKLGRSLNKYDTLLETDIEKAIRKMLTVCPGRRTSDAGEAVERIIIAAKQDGLTRTTPMQLLKWLKGKQPYDLNKPLIVSHPLWTEELQKIKWAEFESLVKSAGRRLRHE